jgi:internalin A
MTALQELWLHDNSLSVLPEGLADLTNLAVLTLSNNQLSALPTGLTSLHGLTEIWLKDNQLRSHPFRQGLMPNLKVLPMLLV